MKSIITTFVSIFCMVLIVLSIFTISGYSTRKNEFEESLSTAMDAAMDNLTFTGGFTKENYMKMIGQLQQDIIIQLNSDGDVEIRILEADMDAGLLDVEVTQTYEWAGLDKKVSVRKTIILDEYNDAEIDSAAKVCLIKFFVDGAEELTARQGVIPGNLVEKPTFEPVKTGKRFVGWYLEGDSNKQIFVENEWSLFTVTQDMNFIALFE